MTRPSIPAHAAWLLLAMLMMLTAAVYWPAMYGGYWFDDGFLVDNPDMHITTLHLGDWLRVALSQAGTNQFRALSMLSFATNFYFTGLDPFWLKLTNVGIHLLNGLLLFLMLRELFRLLVVVQHSNSGDAADPRFDLVAVVLAGAWLLLPINLTGVAYISQRLESLANLFIFLGLYWYMNARRRQYIGAGSGKMMWVSLIVCTALGLSAKEDAALLPLYSACAEFAITGFRERDGQFSRAALWTHFAVLILPFIAGLIWLSTWAFRGFSTLRTFTVGQRLLTESRVLVDYIHWTLLPNLSALSFFHDDLPVSQGLFEPPTTLLAIAALLALLGVAFGQRRTRPLFCLGILWFFAGHSMTATIIPLELVFEHRNYFPSVGLLLAATSLLILEPGLRLAAAKVVLAIGFIVFFAFTTFLRAEEWSNPLRLAYAEALKRPDSPRAQYELARTLIVAAGSSEKSPLIDDSIEILERNAYQPNSGIAPLQALIFLNSRANRDIDPALWQAITKKLQDHAPSQTDVISLIFLLHCQLRGECPPQKQELLDAFAAALTTSGGDVHLTSAYADFAFRELGDRALAEQMFRDVVAAKPQVPVYRANLARFFIVTKQFDAAASAIASLDDLNRFGSLDSTIAALKADLATTKAAPSADATEPMPPLDTFLPKKPDPG